MRFALLSLLALFLAGCGEAGPAATPTSSANLRIVMGQGAAGRTWTLTCGPPLGGSWAGVEVVCERLGTERGRAALAPITAEPRDLVPITKIPLRVHGTIAGDPVDIVIPQRGSSLRRDRYHQIRWLLGPTDFDEAQREAL